MDDEEKKESSNEEEGSLEGVFEDEHAERLKELGIDIKADEITPEQVIYLLDHYPFIQILNSDPKFEDFEGVKISKSHSTGWQIHDLGDALSSSAGELLYEAGNYFGTPPFVLEDEGESGEGGEGGEGGTIYKTSYLIASELVGMAKDRWDGIYIVAGSPYIKWCIWAAAEISKVPIYGYDPDKKDKDRQVRLARYEMQRTTIQRRSGR